MNKRFLTALMVSCISLSLLLTSCASDSSDSENSSSTADTSAVVTSAETKEPEDTTITIKYPAIMQERGFTEPLVLESKPQRVVSMTKAPVFALYELGVNMIAVPEAGVSTYPADLDAATEKLNTTMNSNFDIELVIALEPDLVVMGYHSKDTYGLALDDAGIPVYYVDSGHTVPYSSIKSQSEALVDAFGKDTPEGKAILDRFAALEERINSLKDKYSDQSVMVLQSSPPAHYIQTEQGTLANMAAMLGFKNVYENSETSMAPLDMETALTYNPDLVLCVGGSKLASDHQKLMEDDFAKNPDYWNSIPAIAEGRVLYFSADFVASNGILVTDNINEFIDKIEAFYAE